MSLSVLENTTIYSKLVFIYCSLFYNIITEYKLHLYNYDY